MSDETRDRLAIAVEKVCYIAVKAREFDVKEAVSEMDLGSNPSDEQMREVLADYEDDPVFEELRSLLGSLNVEELTNLIALVWMGRGDYSADEWEAALEEARGAVDEKAPEYLLGIPLLADFLEEGLAALGYSCEDFEMGHL